MVALIFIFLGTTMSNDLVWELTDMFNNLMVIPQRHRPRSGLSPGLPLRCRYCHNPDTQSGGGRPVEDGTLVRRLLRFRSYFDRSGGGVTFSGGEPLAQPDFLLACLRRLKAGVSTPVWTPREPEGEFMGEILAHTDLVLYDVKHHEPAGYKAVTGGDMAATLDFVEAVRRAGTPMWVRHVVVPGLTDSRAHLEGLRAYVDTLPHVERVELLPFHKLGAHKYEALERTDPLAGTPPMDRDLCRRLEREFLLPYTTTAEKGRAV